MAVPVSRRTESKVKFFDNFYKMYDCLMYFVMKDFGIKNKDTGKYFPVSF
jgi:hypothetical protein